MEILLFLFLLNIKHLWVDFYCQTPLMVQCKGIYGDIDGLFHSIQHAIGTMVVCVLYVLIMGFSVGTSLPYMLMVFFGIPILDLILHYHIDYVKMQMERDVRNDSFWRALGCDQFLHQATYIVFAMLMFL